MSDNKSLNIYLVYRETACGYDEYDSLVVVSESEAKARSYTPGCLHFDGVDWVKEDDIGDLVVELVGTTAILPEGRIILSSYNAG